MRRESGKINDEQRLILLLVSRLNLGIVTLVTNGPKRKKIPHLLPQIPLGVRWTLGQRSCPPDWPTGKPILAPPALRCYKPAPDTVKESRSLNQPIKTVI